MKNYTIHGGRDLTDYSVIGDHPAAIRFIRDINQKFIFANRYTGIETDKILFSGDAGSILYSIDESIQNKDAYFITEDENSIKIRAKGDRGLAFAFGMIARKCLFRDGRIYLVKSVAGEYIPNKKIRGHQLGYRDTPNTYDAWDVADYRQYYEDLLAFGVNVVEHIPKDGDRNSLMKYSSEEMTALASELAKEYDLDVSLWYPNTEDTDDEALAVRREMFRKIPRIDFIFPPGGDPGSMQADEFIERVRKFKSVLPPDKASAQLWPSAQAPHKYPDWGEKFIAEMNKLPEEIDGVVMGPNHAYPVHELRRLLPSKYPLRLYTDITHNVRCEYPVHFDRDDWHFALAGPQGRESVNPRPRELKLLHKLSAQYGIGTITYSEGITDDVNKFLWSDMDFFGSDIDLKETLKDYSRYFFPGLDEEKIAEIILGMELCWVGDPKDNPTIPYVWESLCNINYGDENWRFNLLKFRALTDYIIYLRRVFELDLIEAAKLHICKGDLATARTVLETDFDDEYKSLRNQLFTIGERLFKQIGYQCDVEHFGAKNPERGAVLDTVDVPITDRKWLLTLLDNGADADVMYRAIHRNKVDSDELYFSVATNGIEASGVPVQDGEPYMDFQGDDLNLNNGKIPMCLTKVFDNFTFRSKFGGFTPGTDYQIVITYTGKPEEEITHHKITVNGNVVYDGPRFGGEEYPPLYGLYPEEYTVRAYDIPAEFFINGTAEIEFSEPIKGVMWAEFRIVKRH